MRHICSAVVQEQLIAATAVEARAEMSCSPQTAGVSGGIADRKDMIASVNRIGQQLAETRNAAGAPDIQSPLATRPW